MATNEAPTKADFLAALEKKGIKSLEDLIDAVMPEPDETGGYLLMDMGKGFDPADGDEPGLARRSRFSTDLADFGMAMQIAFSALYSEDG